VISVQSYWTETKLNKWWTGHFLLYQAKMEEEQKFKYTSVEFNRIIVLAIRVQLMRLWGTGTTAIVASSCQWFMCFRQFMRDTERV
jgi:hypothetical protein